MVPDAAPRTRARSKRVHARTHVCSRAQCVGYIWTRHSALIPESCFSQRSIFSCSHPVIYKITSKLIIANVGVCLFDLYT